MSRPASALGFTLVLFSAAAAMAQGIRPPYGRQGEGPPTEPFAAQGVVQQVMPGRMQILTNTNQTWLLSIDPKAEVHVKGTAKADYLRVGQYVRFTAEIDRKGRVVGKLEELVLFTPTAPGHIGIWPEGTAGEEQAAGGQAFGAGAANGPGFGAGGGASPAPEAQRYTVAGRIVGARHGTLSINAARAMIQAELAEEPTIYVDVANYLLAQPGDKITVTKGRMPAGLMVLPPGRIGTAQATELSIELAQPLTTAPPKPPHVPRGEKPGQPAGMSPQHEAAEPAAEAAG